MPRTEEAGRRPQLFKTSDRPAPTRSAASEPFRVECHQLYIPCREQPIADLEEMPVHVGRPVIEQRRIIDRCPVADDEQHTPFLGAFAQKSRAPFEGFPIDIFAQDIGVEHLAPAIHIEGGRIERPIKDMHQSA